MGLPWVRLDSNFASNHKVLSLVIEKRWQALFVYCAGLGHSGQHGYAGFIPETALPLIHATKRNAAELVDVGLWIPTPGGWDINDWDEFQPSSEEMAARRTRAKAAAEIRWAKARKKDPA